MTRPSGLDLFRRLPSVDQALKTDAIGALAHEFGRTCVLEAVRAELEALRAAIAAGRIDEEALTGALETFPLAIRERARLAATSSLRRVINASGVVIHTNLGRAPLSRQAAEKLVECATGYSNLEFDLEKGERGRRDDHAKRLLAQLFARQGVGEAETIVVNNNAAAVFLALAALARGGEVIVSRGELVEIGGSFRIPDIMAESGAVLREVGTTNRTRIEDYERAITDNTRLLLRVHRSNFEIVGFTERPELAELAALGQRRGVPVMEDLGSGAMVDMRAFGVPGETGLCDSLRAGASLVTCSGDKLFGGPQAGLVSGRPDLVARLRKHPLFRALRVDKMCYAALEATFAAYLREDYQEIPLLRMLALPAEAVERRCIALATALPGASAEVLPVRTMIGGGAAPGKSLPSFAVVLTPSTLSAADLALALRRRPVPIIARIEDDRVLIDLRTVEEADDGYLAQSLSALKF
jgi:L-seryl-tRNA(Ser) seleniumtransferase